MSKPKTVSDERVREVLPFLRKMLEAEPIRRSAAEEAHANEVYLRVAYFNADTTEAEVARLTKAAESVSAMFKPQEVRTDIDDTGIVMRVKKGLYGLVLAPRYVPQHDRQRGADHPEDRLYRVLNHCGYTNVMLALKHNALEDAVARFRSGGGHKGRSL